MGVREREWYFLFKWLWGPDDQIMEIETSRPESPGHWPEYPGVTGTEIDMQQRPIKLALGFILLLKISVHSKHFRFFFQKILQRFSIWTAHQLVT